MPLRIWIASDDGGGAWYVASPQTADAPPPPPSTPPPPEAGVSAGLRSPSSTAEGVFAALGTLLPSLFPPPAPSWGEELGRAAAAVVAALRPPPTAGASPPQPDAPSGRVVTRPEEE